MAPSGAPKSEPHEDILQVIEDFEQLSIALDDALIGLRHQRDTRQLIPPLERASEKAKLGAEIARRLAGKLAPGD